MDLNACKSVFPKARAQWVLSPPSNADVSELFPFVVLTQSGRAVRALCGGNHHEDRQQVRQHRQKLIGNVHTDGLQPQLQCVDRSEQQRSEKYLPRLPLAENHDRQRDEASGRGDIIDKPVKRDERQEAAAESCQ